MRGFFRFDELRVRMTIFFFLGWGRVLREDVHGGGGGAYGGSVDPGFGLLDGVVVDEVAGFEVVGGVEYEVGGGEEFVDVGWDEVGYVGVDGDGGVEEGDFAAGGVWCWGGEMGVRPLCQGAVV